MKLTVTGLTVLLVGGLMLSPAIAADHNDAAPAVVDAAGDIADVYAWPIHLENLNKPNHLVVALTVNTNAGAHATFSDALVYMITLKQTEGPTYVVRCWFDADGDFRCNLADADDLENPLKNASGPVGETVQHTNNPGAGGFKVYAGLKDDPFFFDAAKFAQTVAEGAPAFADPGTDALAGSNVLAIVVRIGTEVIQGDGSPRFAIEGRTMQRGGM